MPPKGGFHSTRKVSRHRLDVAFIVRDDGFHSTRKVSRDAAYMAEIVPLLGFHSTRKVSRCGAGDGSRSRIRGFHSTRKVSRTARTGLNGGPSRGVSIPLGRFQGWGTPTRKELFTCFHSTRKVSRRGFLAGGTARAQFPFH